MANQAPQALVILTAAAAGTYEKEMPAPERGAHWFLHTLYIFGTFDSATVKFQISPNGNDWFDVDGLTGVTVKTAIQLEFRATHVRGIVTGGVAPAIDMVLI